MSEAHMQPFAQFRFVAEMRAGVILITGAPTLAELAEVTKHLSTEAVIDADAARALGVSLVIGDPAAIQTLRMRGAIRRITP